MAVPVLDRLRRYLQYLAIRYVDPVFMDRHPGPVLERLLRPLACLIRQTQPNDRWSLPFFLPAWTRLLQRPCPASDAQTRSIFLFTCYRTQFTLDLQVALLLAWRGHKVTIGYFPKLRSPIKQPLADSAGAGPYLARCLGRMGGLTGGRIRCIDLSSLMERGEVFDPDFVEQQAKADAILMLQREKLDHADPKVAAAFDYCRGVGLRAQRAAAAWFAEQAAEFDLALFANGSSFEAAQFRHAAERVGLAYTCFEKFAFAKARTISHQGPFYVFSDLDALIEAAERAEGGDPQVLAQGVKPDAADMFRRAARDLMRQRMDSSGTNWGWKYQESTRLLAEDTLRREAGIPKGRFALLCPNVPFDSGYNGWLKLFPSMRDWLVETARHILDHSDMAVVIRAHPAECRPSFGNETVSEILKEAGLTNPRLVVIPGNSAINTYQLMPLCSFGLVFGSTTGMEISMHGKPVLAGASVYHERCNVSIPSRDRADYFANLDSLIGGNDFGMARRQARAELTYGLFHFALQCPFPYDKPSQIVSNPPAGLADDPQIARYLQTIDALALTQPEYAARMATWLDASSNYWMTKDREA